jgi:hypothetical protein
MVVFVIAVELEKGSHLREKEGVLTEIWHFDEAWREVRRCIHGCIASR